MSQILLEYSPIGLYDLNQGVLLKYCDKVLHFIS